MICFNRQSSLPGAVPGKLLTKMPFVNGSKAQIPFVYIIIYRNQLTQPLSKSTYFSKSFSNSGGGEGNSSGGGEGNSSGGGDGNS